METIEKKDKLAQIVAKILEDDQVETLENEEVIHLLLSQNISSKLRIKEKATLADKLSDKLAEVAGSWTFLISFGLVLVVWILINIKFLISPFDPFPFILLNLVLSCIAAVQAPIIMMSQNRQDKKDRIRSENDYIINVKSEIILEDLHNKMDQLIANQTDVKEKLATLEQKIQE